MLQLSQLTRNYIKYIASTAFTTHDVILHEHGQVSHIANKIFRLCSLVQMNVNQQKIHLQEFVKYTMKNEEYSGKSQRHKGTILGYARIHRYPDPD